MNVILDLQLDQVSDLPLDICIEALIPRTVIASSLSDLRSHVEVITG